MAAVPISDTVDWIASFPNWNIPFSTPEGDTDIQDSADYPPVRADRQIIFQYNLQIFSSQSDHNNDHGKDPCQQGCESRTRNSQMQFPYKKQIQRQIHSVCRTEIIIGKRLFSCALRIDAPSSYRAINGYETAEIKKYCLAFSITSAQLLRRLTLRI